MPSFRKALENKNLMAYSKKLTLLTRFPGGDIKKQNTLNGVSAAANYVNAQSGPTHFRTVTIFLLGDL